MITSCGEGNNPPWVAKNGIAIVAGGGSVIVGNFVGTNSGGSVAGVGNGGYGVFVANNSASNRIGTDGAKSDVKDRNIISGNAGEGIELAGLSPNNTKRKPTLSCPLRQHACSNGTVRCLAKTS
jgi:hypothetical protein